MRIEGRVAIEAPRDRVWNFLINPADIAGCAPGLESWREVVPAREFELIGAVSIGGTQGKMRLPATVRWHDVDAPRRLATTAVIPIAGNRLTVDGTVDLTAHPDASTQLAFTLEAQLEDGVAPPARRLVANMMPGVVERFFRCFKAQLETAIARES